MFHLIPGHVPSGFAGVDIFFTLSGFLITLLLDQIAQTHSLGLRSFWVRRFRRLTPAVVTTTIITTCLALRVGGDALVALRRQTFGALTGTYNWFEIADESSYFDNFSPLLLTNMWSLAVEQQFDLVWPFVLILILALPPILRRWYTVLLGCISILAFILLEPGNLSRSYMGTDTHLWGLMFGAALALTYPRALRGTQHCRRTCGHTLFWSAAGWMSLITLCILLAFAPTT